MSTFGWHLQRIHDR